MALKILGQISSPSGQWYTVTVSDGQECYCTDLKRDDLPVIGSCQVEKTGQLTVWRTDRQPGPPPWGDKPW